MKRLFIGGCSRSGTTFLQELLANHPRVLTFPETGVFLKALGMRGHLLPWVYLGLTLGKERKALKRLLKELGIPHGQAPSVPPRRFLLRSSVRDIVSFFDALAEHRDRDTWLEKTPRHVLHAARIRRMVPDCTFIHMVRDGRDVVASIVDRARRFPDDFPRQDDPSYGIRQWNHSMDATRKAMREPGHVLVLYRTLSTHPKETLQSLCRALDMEFSQAMLDREGTRDFVTDREGWKDRPTGPILPAPSKFPRLFDEATRESIEDRLEMTFFQAVSDRMKQEPGTVWVSGETPWPD